jgi:CcmD family protein
MISKAFTTRRIKIFSILFLIFIQTFNATSEQSSNDKTKAYFSETEAKELASILADSQTNGGDSIVEQVTITTPQKQMDNEANTIVTDNGVEMLNWMTQSAKMNVVISVIFIIFLVLFLFLFRLDRKISKLEKEFKS